MDCPDDNAILGFVERTLPPGDRERVAQHVDGCPACFAIVTDFSRTAGEPEPDRAGDPSRRYVLLSTLGAGGMGVVHAAFDRELDRKVALKFLSPASGEEPARARSRLQREAQALAKLSHPNVVTVYEVGVLDGEVFVAMELVDGVTLREWLARAPRSTKEIVAILLQAGEGLAAAHRAGFIHRDFKPENVLVGNDGRVRVTDFGLARALDKAARPAREAEPAEGAGVAAEGVALTRTGVNAGTPAYMAPEQATGGVADARTDLYSYCVTLHEAVTGARPADRAHDAHDAHGGKAKRQAPAWLDRILARGLRERPEERWPSMRELLDSLAEGPPRTVRNASLAALALLVAAGAWVAVAHARRPVCTDVGALWGSTWSEPQRTAVSAAFGRSGKPGVDTLFAGVDRLMQAYRSQWVTVATDACLATRARGVQSEAMLDHRMACLDDRRRVAGHLAELLEAPDPALVEKAQSAVAELPSLDGCSDLDALTQLLPLPADPASRAEVARLADIAAQVEALISASAVKRAHDLIGPAVEAAARLGYRPIWGRLRYLQGRVASDYDWAASARDLGRSTPVEDAYREAAALAMEGHDDATAVLAWRWLAYEEGYRWHHPVEGRAALRYAEAAVTRLGSNDLDEAGIQRTTSLIDEADGRWEEGLAAIQKGRALLLRSKGEDPILLAPFENTMGALLEDLGRLDEALAAYESNVAMLIRSAGPAHRNLVGGYENQAEVLRLLGRRQEAVEVDRRALALIRQRGETPTAYDRVELAISLRGVGSVTEALDLDRQAVQEDASNPHATDFQTSRALLGVGLDLLELHRAPEAIAPLERAARLRADLTPPDWENRFALARALQDGGGDHARAISLARQALDVLGPSAQRYGSQYRDEADRIDRWLADRAPR
jgi:serine/threonine protein kinase/tetratricopeptide (TPR) repeat protein